MTYLLLFVVITGIVGLLSGGWAAKKGYNYFIWFFASSILGFIILACLPVTNRGNPSSQEVAQRRATGNMIGVVLAALAVLVSVLQVLQLMATG